MKTKKIISLALMLGLSVTVINGCGTKEDSSANKKEESAYAVSSEMKEESISTTKPEAEKKTHSEYVTTYSVYAEQGAVVTWYDSQTGQFRYKDKCETCGQVASSEHNNRYFIAMT